MTVSPARRVFTAREPPLEIAMSARISVPSVLCLVLPASLAMAQPISRASYEQFQAQAPLGAGVIDIVESCPSYSVYSQPAEEPANNVTSEIDTGLAAADNFVLPRAGWITGVHFWGLSVEHAGGAWTPCDDLPAVFTVSVYASAAGRPDYSQLLFEHEGEALRSDRGEGTFFGRTIWYYQVFFDGATWYLPAEEEFWIEIVGRGNEACWFLWSNMAYIHMGPGDWRAWQQGSANPELGFDLSFCLTEAPAATGDINCDGEIDCMDIDPFVLALTAPSAFIRQYPHCPLTLADMNGDRYVDIMDVDPFVAIIAHGD